MKSGSFWTRQAPWPQSAGISVPLDEDAATLLATAYHELRQGISAEGMRLKSPPL